MTSIKGLVQVNLREARAQGLPQEDRAVIEQEIRRMERTLQTFLVFARPPKPERRRLEPAAVVERVFALVGGRAKKQGVSLRLIQPATPIWLDSSNRDADAHWIGNGFPVRTLFSYQTLGQCIRSTSQSPLTACS